MNSISFVELKVKVCKLLIPSEIFDSNLYILSIIFESKLKCIDLVFLSSCHSEVAGKLFKKHGAKNVIYIDKDDKNPWFAEGVSIDLRRNYENTEYINIKDVNRYPSFSASRPVPRV